MTKPVNHRLPVLGPDYRPPNTRGECIAGTPNTSSRDERQAGKAQCCAFECRYNLLVEHSENRPGRRYSGIAPEWSFRGDNPSATSPSCLLDVTDAHPNGLPASEVARVLGISKRRVEQILKAWRTKQGAADVVKLHSAVMDNMEDE